LLPWRDDLQDQGAALAKSLEAIDDADFAVAVKKEADQRYRLFNQGVATYKEHSYRRSLKEPPVLWQEGSTRLLDYAPGKAAPPLLLVPSLINKAYVLDLKEKRSLARHLANKGFRPLLVDWGAPGDVERSFTMTDYVAGRLESALDAALKETKAKSLGMIGYCMGGTLALALAQRRPDALNRLAFLATPWDFHAGAPGRKEQMQAFAAQMDPMIEVQGELSIDLIQTLFATLDPFKVPSKFCKLAALDPTSAKSQDFVAIEDWVNDGVPLAGPVARETMWKWYGENTPAWGAWQIDGRPVLPEEVKTPSLVVVPSNDTIVPPESALALFNILPNATKRVLSQGHISMMAGPKAASALYGPISQWFAPKP